MSLAGVVVVSVALWLVWTTVHAVYVWMTRHWYVPVLVLVVVAAAIRTVMIDRAEERRQHQERLRRLRYTMEEIDAMTPTQFELACRDLVRRDGRVARHVGGAGDEAADVIATDRDGNIIVVQCKHTTRGKNIGVKVMYEVKGTASFSHQASIAIVATNGGFTSPAREWASRHGIHLLDRAKLARWAAHGHALHEVLGIAPPSTDPASPPTPRP